MGYSISILFFQMLKGQLLTLLANEMDRKHFLMLFFLWWIALPMTAQPHLSEAFVLEGEWTLDSGDGVLQPQGMVGCVEGNSLYCCHRRSFQNKENGFAATVCAIDLSTGRMTNYFIPLPEKKANATVARRYWIRGVRVMGNRLFLSLQNGVLVYQKGKNNKYDFVRRIPTDLPDGLFVANGKLAVVERVPEEGRFVFKLQKEHGSDFDSVRGLQLPAPFMLQYEPNGFVRQTGKALYFVVSPELRIEKYALDGKLLAVIRPQIPRWQPMPDELVRKISEMPYGSDRAMFTFFHTKECSFPLEVHPLNDSMLMLSYHHYDSSEKKEQVLTAMVCYGEEGQVVRVVPYSHYFTEDSVIGREMFPLYYAQRELCLQVVDEERIVQIVREAPVEWRGKTGRAYADSVERYFASGMPEYRVRVAKLRTDGAERRCDIRDLELRTYEGKAFTEWETSLSGTIFIVNNPPQCHSCEESLFSFVSTIDTAICKVCVVFNNADSYLAKRDQIEDVRKHLTVPFTPLFVPTEGKDKFLKTIGVSVFPAVILQNVGSSEAMVLSGTEIYGAGHSSALNQTFVRKITKFLYGKGGTGK